MAKQRAAGACKKCGKDVQKLLTYRMEMTLPLARVSSPVRYHPKLANKFQVSSSRKNLWLTVGRLLPLDWWLAGAPPAAAHVGKVLPNPVEEIKFSDLESLGPASQFPFSE